MNLYSLVFSYSQEYNDNFFILLSILSIISAILVIINKNPIVSVLFLICLFVFISGYLILSGMNFIGLSYLLVYIGAVSILFLFILMLLNIRISEIQVEKSNSLPLAIYISIAFYISLDNILPLEVKNTVNLFFNKFSTITTLTEQVDFSDVKFISINQWETNLVEILHITSIGNIMYTNYFFWLILVSIILLLAMVGTIIITIKQ